MLFFTKDHQWAKVEGNNAIIGITDFAQNSLGDIIFIKSPKVGSQITANGYLGDVESTKSVSEVYAPVSGKILQINDKLINHPELINIAPYDDGWIAVIEMSNMKELDNLLSKQQYEEFISTNR